MSYSWKQGINNSWGLYRDKVLLLILKDTYYSSYPSAVNAGSNAVVQYMENAKIINEVELKIETKEQLKKIFQEAYLPVYNAARAAAAAAASSSASSSSVVARSAASASNSSALATSTAASSSSAYMRDDFLNILVKAVNELENANLDELINKYDTIIKKKEAEARAAEEAEARAAEEAEARAAEEAEAEARAAEAAATVAKKQRLNNPSQVRNRPIRGVVEAAKAAARAANEAKEAAKRAVEEAKQEKEKAKEAKKELKNQGERKYQSTITLKELKEKISKIKPELLQLPEWAKDLPEIIKDKLLLATIYNYVDQVHDIKNVEEFKESRVRAVAFGTLATCLPGRAESNIETILFDLFNKSLGELSHVNIFKNVKVNTDNPTRFLVELKGQINELLIGRDGGGLAAKTFPPSIDFPTCHTFTAKYDPAPALPANLIKSDKPQTMTFGDVGNKFRIRYTFDGTDTTRFIIINGKEISCESLFDNTTVCCAMAGVSATIYGLERLHTLYSDVDESIFTSEGSREHEEILINLIAGFMYRLKNRIPEINGSFKASASRGSQNTNKASPHAKSIFLKKVYASEASINRVEYKNFIPIAQIVLALTRQCLKDYKGPIESFRENPLRLSLMTTIGRLKSYCDIHYLSEMLIRCKISKKKLFMTSVDRGVAGLTRHLASILQIDATVVVHLDQGHLHNLHVFKYTPPADALKLNLDECCRTLNILDLHGFGHEFTYAVLLCCWCCCW
jgi:hypothetical protein